MPDDYSAIGGYNAIKDLGLRIPDDVSVVGYDGIEFCDYLSPMLTTYRQNTAEIGAQAARKLIAQIDNPTTTFTEVISVEGEIREGGSVKSIN
jgi:LacI family transcriptional regulator